MDGGGRLARSLTARLDRAAADALLYAHRRLIAWHNRRMAEAQAASAEPYARPSAFDFWMRRLSVRIANLRVPRFAGLALTLALFAGVGVYGLQRGGHGPAVAASLQAAGDALAGSAGMKVEAVLLSGARQLSHAEVLAAAGVTPTTSVLFFDPLAARERLKADPWIAEATVQKLYPDRLLIAVEERDAFALWQRAGRIAVVGRDGAVIADRLDGRFLDLPLVVGPGADRRAAEIVGALRRHPAIAAQVRASVLVAERRWSLALKNGIDVRLPETDLDAALARLARLDAEKKLLTRDLVSIDLRVAGRIAVRLSEDAFKAHEAALRDRQRARRQGRDA